MRRFAVTARDLLVFDVVHDFPPRLCKERREDV
jgi:hypothetical protein